MSLIWGEAANLRFCPEFLAFVYHHLANDLANRRASWLTTSPQGEKESCSFLLRVGSGLRNRVGGIGSGLSGSGWG